VRRFNYRNAFEIFHALSPRAYWTCQSMFTLNLKYKAVLVSENALSLRIFHVQRMHLLFILVLSGAHPDVVQHTK
jgi:hypothetical protein